AKPEVRQCRHTDPDHVEPGMVVKLLILNGDQRLHEVRRDLIERNLDPLFLENRKRELIAAVVNGGRLIHLSDAPPRFRTWQPASKIDNEPDEPNKDGRCDQRGSEQEPLNQFWPFGVELAPPSRQPG